MVHTPLGPLTTWVPKI
jgi:hypothetical protein